MKMGQIRQKEVIWEEMVNSCDVRNNCLKIYLSVESMREEEEWTTPALPNGDHGIPLSALLSHCGFMCFGHYECSCL